jgi:hypothetical protein
LWTVTSCKAGSFLDIAPSNKTDGNCTICKEIGYYCAGGVAEPTLCESGFYCPTSSEKLSCPQGGYCPFNSTAVTLCPAGSRGVIEGSFDATNCIACLPGTYASSEGALACLTCEIGKYASAANSLLCEQCSETPLCIPGEYLVECNATNKPECLQCNQADKPSNSHWTWSGTLTQTGSVHDSVCSWNCNQGYFRSNSNACQGCKTPSSCAIGEYVTNCNSTFDGVCLSCYNKPVNSIYTGASELYEISDCSWRCDNGYRKTKTSMICEACAPGTYAVDSPDECIPCQAGTFSSESSASVCLDCSFTTYTTGTGASACLPCLPCSDNGFYRNNCKGGSAGVCFKCVNTIN